MRFIRPIQVKACFHRGSFALAALALAAIAAAPAQAQRFTTRPQLTAALSSSVTDGFETFNVANGTQNFTNVTSINNTTIINGQGPNLVLPGVTYTSGSGFFWNGAAFFGTTSKSLGASAGFGMTLTYTGSVQAFGLDIVAFTGFPTSGTITVRDLSSAVLDTFNYSVPSAGSVFYGFQNAAGIGTVTFSTPNNGGIVNIDNHTYGSVATTAPEPGSLALLALAGLPVVGLIGRMRK